MAMHRQRTIRPEIFRNENLAALSPETRLTAIGLHLYADDHGRESATAALIKGALWPLDRDVTEATIEEHLVDLADAGWLILYDHGGRTYYSLTDWPRVDRPADSILPAPPVAPPAKASAPREPIANTSGSFPVGEREGEGARGSEGEGAWRDAEWARASAEGERRSRTDRESADTTRAPSPFCRSHPNGTDNPCRSCGTARLRHKQWVAEQVDRAAPRGPRFDASPEEAGYEPTGTEN